MFSFCANSQRLGTFVAVCSTIQRNWEIITKARELVKVFMAVTDNHRYCHFWCPERGPVLVDIKDKECEIFGCVSSEISIRGKAGSVLIGTW